MASFGLEQQLRNEMQSKFNVKWKPNPKKRKLTIDGYPESKKKQKLADTKTAPSSTKQSSIQQLKALGLVQTLQRESPTHLIHHHRSSFPARNDSWKQKKPRSTQKKMNHHQKHRSNKTQMNKLHHDIHIYPFKSHLWYNLGDILSNNDKLSGHRIDKRELLSMDHSSIFMIAESLYDALTKRDTIRNEFHNFALSKGTFRDKLSTMIFRVEQFSLTRLRHLDSMLDILSQDTKRQSVSVIPSMIDLFIKSLLPQRHLVVFNHQLARIEEDKAIESLSQMDLILFYFEHSLKTKYKAFIELLEFYATNNEIEKLHYESSVGLYRLLMNKPENESFLLNLLINKFGENDKDFTRRITEYLLKISAKHPMMKPDIIRETHNYLKRPSLSPRGLYRAVFFLSKLRFCSLENEAATLLCGIYMDLFKQLISYQSVFDVMNDKKRSNPHAQSMEVLDAMLRDPDPRSDSNSNHHNTQLNVMKKLITMTRKKRNIYFKTHRKELAIWKRFVLLEEITPKLLSCILKGIAYVFPLANLNLKVFKRDLDYIYKLILKSNMKIALMALQFTFRVESTAEIAMSGSNITDKTPRQLIKYSKDRKVEITKNARVTPSDRFYQILYAIGSRWDFVVYSHPQIVFNLIYQAIKCDTNQARICAFIRRLIQFCSYGSVEWICGSLYLLSAVVQIHPFVADLMGHKPRNDTVQRYDVNEYEPKLANAASCPMWELSALSRHMHPAVRDFAKQLLEHQHIEYNGDPLKDFKRKVLFEKFTRIMAHKMKEFKPNMKWNAKDEKHKAQLMESYLAGDAFIAMYKEHEGTPRITKAEGEKEEEEREEDIDLADDERLADTAMFGWLKSHYGSEVPDDRFEDDEEYDYSELKKEIKQQETQKQMIELQEEEVSDMDVYLSDMERSEEDETENENIVLPPDVEYASNDDDDDEISDDLDQEQEVTEHDFFNQNGIGAGELQVD